MKKTSFERLLFASRWLLVPFYIALVIALLALVGKVGVHAYELASKLSFFSEEDVILGALGIVDLTLTASLVVLVIFSSYANFISKIETDDHADWPTWMITIDFSELKLKLISSIVAIGAIRLLEAYLNVDHENDRDLAWQAGIYGIFVVSALLLGLAEWLGHNSDSAHD